MKEIIFYSYLESLICVIYFVSPFFECRAERGVDRWCWSLSFSRYDGVTQWPCLVRLAMPDEDVRSQCISLDHSPGKPTDEVINGTPNAPPLTGLTTSQIPLCQVAQSLNPTVTLEGPDWILDRIGLGLISSPLGCVVLFSVKRCCEIQLIVLYCYL